MTNTKKHLTITTITILAAAAFHSLPAFAETTKYSTEIAPALKITIPADTIDITVDPSSKPFDSKNFSITVATNNLTGYNLTMSSESTSLIKTDDSTKTIPTLTALDGGYTQDTFEANKWGYKIGSANYIPFVSGAEIARSDSTTNGDTTTMTFATKVDFLQSAGVYKTELNFTAVVNPLPTYIQNLDASMCTEDPLLVVDNRDNEEYLVQRLADGNCWMLDNLRLDPTEVSLDALKGNTNATNEILTYFKTGGGESPYPADGVSSEWTSDSYELPLVDANYKDVVASTTYGSGSGKIGVRYNYCAASAGSYCYSASSGTGNAAYDICPTGWRLPVGGDASDSTNEFNNLYLAYDSDHVTYKTALSLLLSGANGDGSGSSYGYFWSSVPSSDRAMGILRVHPQYAAPGNSFFRYYGSSVRCILKPAGPYLQDITSAMVDNMAVGDTAVYKDKRDEEEYLVGKLADGNLWLLDNLRLDPTVVSLDKLKGNTNATDESLTALKNGGGESPYAVNGVSTDWTGARSGNWGVGYSSPYVYVDNKDTVASVSYGNGSNKYGVYYNYCAATAGSYCYAAYATESGVISEDICPKGWRLPKGDYPNGVDEFGDLYDILYEANDYNSSSANASFNKDLSVVIAGDFYDYNDGPENVDERGIFWTSKWGGSRYIATVQVRSGSFWPHASTNDVRDRGVSVRCIFDI